MNSEKIIVSSSGLLRYAYALVLILVGLDKVFQTNVIVNWEGYVGDFARSVVPLAPLTIVLIFGIVEIIVGVMLLTDWIKVASYLVIGALVVTIINLLSMGLYDIAVRDVLLVCGVVVLGWLMDARRNIRAQV